MKLRELILSVALVVSVVGALSAKPVAGLKGGRIVTTEAPPIEFFVEKDHTVAVTFYDPALKPITPSSQTISIIAEAKSGKEKFELDRTSAGFASKQSLPAGEGYTMVMQVGDEAGAKPKNDRIVFHDEIGPNANARNTPAFAKMAAPRNTKIKSLHSAEPNPAMKPTKRKPSSSAENEQIASYLVVGGVALGSFSGHVAGVVQGRTLFFMQLGVVADVCSGGVAVLGTVLRFRESKRE